MINTTARLARSITWASSKQSYITARLLADRDLTDDCLRAYAYFRWADDRIDVCLTTRIERVVFIERQKNLTDALFQGERPDDLSPEEAMLADLVAHDHVPDGGLRSFIRNFMAVIEFDAYRKGRIVSRHELDAYTTCLATAVMDGIQYFIGNGHPYRKTLDRNLAVTGAHITHMLRDTLEDLSCGLINVPAEYLNDHAVDIKDGNSEQFRQWVRGQVEMARFFFQAGKTYIDSLDVLRCKLAGVWYCARFECVLNAIERDSYRLRAEYPERHSLKIWLEMVRLGIVVLLEHFIRRIRCLFLRLDYPSELNPDWNMSSYQKIRKTKKVSLG
jgi:phytoene/squalene synthetase